MNGEVLRLEVLDGGEISGEAALDLPPGTTAAARDRALNTLLSARLTEIAAARGVVLSAPASAYAFQSPGKDDQKRTRFVVRGRVEGDRLLPARPR
jgi:hypothetical protein